MVASLLSLCLLMTAPSTPDFIRVAGDGFTFVTASGERYLPMGAFYLDERHGEIDPLNWWGHFDEAHVRADFKRAAALGCNLLRVRIDPAVDGAEVFSEEDFEHCDVLLDAAQRNGLRLYLGLHLPGRFKQDPRYQEAWVSAYRRAGERYRNHPAVFCWELDAEATVLVGYPGDRERWRAWLEQRYPDEAANAHAWGLEVRPGWRDAVWDRFTHALHHHAGRDEVRDVEPSLWYLDALNDEDNACLYDWQCFREHLYTVKIRPLAEAVRAADPNHLVTVDLILWAFPFVRNPGPAGWGGPYGYAGIDLRAVGELVDFFGLHTYPQYIPPFTSEWYENLTKDPAIFDRQLRYIETLCRYVRVASGKPVLHTETGWHGGGGDYYGNSEADQLRWNTAIIDATKDCALGWVNWTLRDVPTHEGLTAWGGMLGPAIRTRPDTDNENPLSDYLYAGDLPPDQANRSKAWGEAFRGVVDRMHADMALRYVPGTPVALPRRFTYTAPLRALDAAFQDCIADDLFPADIVLEDFDTTAPETEPQRRGAAIIERARQAATPSAPVKAGTEKLLGVTP